MTTDNTDQTPQNSLFNFVIYTDDARRMEYFQQIIQVVTEEYPCRVLFLLAEHENNDHIEIETKGKLTQIKASGKDVSRLPYLFFRHLVPGIPIYLLWGQEPFIDDPILPYLEQYCTRLIYDSESCDNLSKMACQLMKRMDHLHGDIIDMNWARVAGWRRIISQTFDCKSRLQDLQEAELLRIKFNSHHTAPFHHCEAQAYYLQAWIGAAFNWKFKQSSMQNQARQLSYEYQNQNITVELIAEERPDLHPGALLSVECKSGHDRHYMMQRMKDNPRQVRVEITMETTCELPFNISLPSSSAGMVLLREILFTPPSEHYILMIRSLAEFNNIHQQEVMR